MIEAREPDRWARSQWKMTLSEFRNCSFVWSTRIFPSGASPTAFRKLSLFHDIFETSSDCGGGHRKWIKAYGAGYEVRLMMFQLKTDIPCDVIGVSPIRCSNWEKQGSSVAVVVGWCEFPTFFFFRVHYRTCTMELFGEFHASVL